MKKINSILLMLALSTIFISCNEDKTSKIVITEANTTDNYEVIGYPVKLHYIKRSGMNYMIASGYYGEAGTSITNLTLDSLQVEYYKCLLK